MTRADGAGGATWIDEDFCSQEHAARWLSRPLPDPAPVEPYAPTGSDRLASAVFATAVGTVLTLTVIGLVTSFRLLLRLL